MSDEEYTYLICQYLPSDLKKRWIAGACKALMPSGRHVGTVNFGIAAAADSGKLVALTLKRCAVH